MQLISVTPIKNCPELRCLICKDRKATIKLSLKDGILILNVPVCGSCGRLDMAIMEEILIIKPKLKTIVKRKCD